MTTITTALLATVHFDLTDAAELPLTSGHLEWVPSRGLRQDARLLGGGRVVYPAAFTVPIATTMPDLQLTATDDPRFTGHPWCWQVTERIPRGGRTRWVLVPHSSTPVAYSALVEVDPSTFAPTAAPPAAWVVALAQANALIADLIARVQVLEADDPALSIPAGYLPEFLESYL